MLSCSEHHDPCCAPVDKRPCSVRIDKRQCGAQIDRRETLKRVLVSLQNERQADLAPAYQSSITWCVERLKLFGVSTTVEFSAGASIGEHRVLSRGHFRGLFQGRVITAIKLDDGRFVSFCEHRPDGGSIHGEKHDVMIVR